MEKFHGAVIDHVGHLDTRVGREATRQEMLARLPGSQVAVLEARVAIVFDQQNRWALDDAEGPRNMGMEYEKGKSTSTIVRSGEKALRWMSLTLTAI